MEYHDRNTVWGFSSRTIKNLEYLNKAWRAGGDVHVVTQLVTSLLALIVFPYQEIADRNIAELKAIQLAELETRGWPAWRIDIGTSINFQDHVRHLRNAISYRRVYFSSDDRDPAQVEIAFRDGVSNRGDWKWGAVIGALALEEFVLRFAAFLQERERDNS
jgi:HEPN pEK499 p136